MSATGTLARILQCKARQYYEGRRVTRHTPTLNLTTMSHSALVSRSRPTSIVNHYETMRLGDISRLFTQFLLCIVSQPQRHVSDLRFATLRPEHDVLASRLTSPRFCACMAFYCLRPRVGLLSDTHLRATLYCSLRQPSATILKSLGPGKSHLATIHVTIKLRLRSNWLSGMIECIPSLLTASDCDLSLGYDDLGNYHQCTGGLSM